MKITETQNELQFKNTDSSQLSVPVLIFIGIAIFALGAVQRNPVFLLLGPFMIAGAIYLARLGGSRTVVLSRSGPSSLTYKKKVTQFELSNILSVLVDERESFTTDIDSVQTNEIHSNVIIQLKDSSKIIAWEANTGATDIANIFAQIGNHATKSSPRQLADRIAQFAGVQATYPQSKTASAVPSSAAPAAASGLQIEIKNAFSVSALGPDVLVIGGIVLSGNISPNTAVTVNNTVAEITTIDQVNGSTVSFGLRTSLPKETLHGAIIYGAPAAAQQPQQTTISPEQTQAQQS